eukprot:58357-Rhodomonas_salina.3
MDGKDELDQAPSASCVGIQAFAKSTVCLPYSGNRNQIHAHTVLVQPLSNSRTTRFDFAVFGLNSRDQVGSWTGAQGCCQCHCASGNLVGTRGWTFRFWSPTNPVTTSTYYRMRPFISMSRVDRNSWRCDTSVQGGVRQAQEKTSLGLKTYH